MAKQKIKVGSVWQSMGGIDLRVVVDVTETHVGYKYVMGNNGMSRTAEVYLEEFLDNYTLFYEPQ